jgi:PhzF family phenazine biosynthesis protein
MIPVYHVDVFTSELFRGNPAAVCPLANWLPDKLLLAIAMENQCPETAFCILGRDPMPLRWFSPRTEVPLCGHATLATGFALLTLDPRRHQIEFETASGHLRVERAGHRYALDLPAIDLGDPLPEELSRRLLANLGIPSTSGNCFGNNRHLVVILENPCDVEQAQPNFPELMALDSRDILITAPGIKHDFVSRYFAPSIGIPEDPVTGSAHGLLVPYWSKRLGRKVLRARQCSPRGGELSGEWQGDRVRLEGDCRLYLRGEILIDGTAC